MSHNYRTYCLDFTSQLRGKEFVLFGGDSLKIDESIAPLEDMDFGIVDTVSELLISVAAAPVSAMASSDLSAAQAPVSAVASPALSAAEAPGVCMLTAKVQQARPITEVLKKNKGKKRPSVEAGASSGSASSADDASADDADNNVEFAKAAKFLSSSESDSSGFSVDTDVDSGVEATPDAVLKKIISVHVNKDGSKPIRELNEEFDNSGSEEDSAARAPAAIAVDGVTRHAAGTWKIWEGTWFYATKAPGFTDVKLLMKQPFRNVSTGMGVAMMSKALSPHHYGETWEEPVKTIILLKCWGVWRARWIGWCRQKDCRQREVSRQVERLTAEIISVQRALPARPLLGSLAAETLLGKWVPDIVGSLTSR